MSLYVLYLLTITLYHISHPDSPFSLTQIVSFLSEFSLATRWFTLIIILWKHPLHSCINLRKLPPTCMQMNRRTRQQRRMLRFLGVNELLKCYAINAVGECLKEEQISDSPIMWRDEIKVCCCCGTTKEQMRCRSRSTREPENLNCKLAVHSFGRILKQQKERPHPQMCFMFYTDKEINYCFRHYRHH